jgi:hypothetical protein
VAAKSHYCLTGVPAALKGAANAAAASLADFPGEAGDFFPVPLWGTAEDAAAGTADPVAYLGCSATGPETPAALPTLKAALPGSDFAAVAAADWAGFDVDGWLADRGWFRRGAGS